MCLITLCIIFHFILSFILSPVFISQLKDYIKLQQISSTKNRKKAFKFKNKTFSIIVSWEKSTKNWCLRQYLCFSWYSTASFSFLSRISIFAFIFVLNSIIIQPWPALKVIYCTWPTCMTLQKPSQQHSCARVPHFPHFQKQSGAYLFSGNLTKHRGSFVFLGAQ